MARVGSRIAARLRGEQSIRGWLKAGLQSTGSFYAAAHVELDVQCAWAITIEDDVTLGPHVRVIAHDSSTWRDSGRTAVRPVRIGARSYIGTGAIILPGASIGADCVIGAGSVVHGEIPDGSVAVGNPARVVTTTRELVARHEEELAASTYLEILPASATETDRQRLREAIDRYGVVYVP